MQEESAEPDYRFTLANERTFLAWTRTALGLLAASAATVHLGTGYGISPVWRVLGVLLALLATVVCAAGLRRWRVVQSSMRRGEDLPPSRGPVVIGLGLALISAVVLLLAVFGLS